MRRVIDFSDIEGIPAEALEKLENIEMDVYASRRLQWEPWQDQLLVRLWESKARKTDIAKVIGYSQHSCRARYNELIQEGK